MKRGFDAVLAFSLANLLLYRIWNELLDPALLYHSRELPKGQLLAAVLNVALLGAGFFLLFRLVRRHAKMLRVAPVGFWVMILAWAGLFRLLARPLEGTLLWMLGGTALLVTGVAWVSGQGWGRRVTRAASVLVCLTFPFLLFTMASAFWRVAASDENAFQDRSRAPRGAVRPAPRRVVWVVFDELGQAQAFERRPAGVEMPVFDHMRHTSFYATSARPAGPTTLTALPALLLGQPVQSARADGPAELELSLEESRERDEETLLLSSVANVFDSVRSLGMESSLTGWYHPYCRVLGPSLNECLWAPGPLLLGALTRDAGVGAAMLEQQRETLQWLFRVDVLPWFEDDRREEREVRAAQDAFQKLLRHGVAAAADPSLGLVFIHLPVPHPPGIYDSESETLSDGVRTSYADNLEIADLALGEIVDAVEESGAGDTTALVVTADHAWRASFWRGKSGWSELDEASYDDEADKGHVPLLIRMPSARQHTCETPVDTLRLREAVEAFLTGGLSSTADVGELLCAEL